MQLRIKKYIEDRIMDLFLILQKEHCNLNTILIHKGKRIWYDSLYNKF